MAPPQHPGRTGNLQQLQDLLRPSLLEPIFVAIDFERFKNIRNGFRFRHGPGHDAQVGLSILDSRDLVTGLATYNFITGTESYFEESAPRYVWGASEKISTGNMLKKINACLPRDRKIVLVGHGFSGDRIALKSLGFDFQTSIVGDFDTFGIAQDLGMGQLSLRHLLATLDCPSLKLHNAGNDANFTLRAFILLGIKSFQAAVIDGSETAGLERVEALWSLALKDIPIRQQQVKKLKPRKKHVAKLRTPEEQEAIREDRRQKRDAATTKSITALEPQATTLCTSKHRSCIQISFHSSENYTQLAMRTNTAL